MTAPRYVSPCCGAECEYRYDVDDEESLHFCRSCGQPCDPMPADVRDKIVADGMRRAAGLCVDKRDAMCVRREADKLVANRRDLSTTADVSGQEG